MLGQCQIAEVRYGAVSAFLNTSNKETKLPPKSMYEMLCNYVGLLEDASSFSTGMLAKLDDEVQACLNGNGVAKKGTYLYFLLYIFMHCHSNPSTPTPWGIWRGGIHFLGV